MSEKGNDWLFVLIAVCCIPLGGIIGFSLGYDELGQPGAIIGALAGCFVGYLTAYLVSFLFILGFAAIIILGPIALIGSISYFLLEAATAQ